MSTKPNPPIYNIEEHPSFRGVVNEVKDEVRDFLRTRWELLRTELKQKSAIYKASLPLIAIGALLLLVGFVFLNVAVCALIASAFHAGMIGWCYSAAILFGAYFLFGGALAWFGMAEIKKNSLIPTHTLKVLKQDQNWIQQEARTQL